MSKRVTIRTDLVAAIARIARDEKTRRHVTHVWFRPDEIVATDGIRLVRVPYPVGFEAKVHRSQLLAAAAAKGELDDGLCTVDDWGEEVMVLSTVDIWVEGETAFVKVADGVTVSGPVFAGDFPDIEAVCPKPSESPPPAGIRLDPGLMAGAHEVIAAINARDGVQLAGWGGVMDPVMFKAPESGVRYVLMPMRQP